MTVKELIEHLQSIEDQNMAVVVKYNDPGSDEPLYLDAGEIYCGTFYNWDIENVSEESLIIEI